MMEGTASHVPVIDYLSETFPDHEFMLVDVGCSGGIDPIWRRFGSRLRALGVDPNVVEMERLAGTETHPGISYVAARAGLPPDHSFAQLKRDGGYWGRNPWERLSTAKSIERMQRDRRLSDSEMVAANRWAEMRLSHKVIVIPSYLQDRGTLSVDFLKIDVDGADFEVLNSFDQTLDSLGVLGVGIEVNYFGSASDADHTFHNVDRFMKARGFEIFGLTVRRYSVATLPSRYVWRLPAETEFGRPLQGDALYVRDLASGAYDAFAAQLPLTKVLNLICIFAAFNLPDCASEITMRFRDKLGPSCRVDRILDLLAVQAQSPIDEPLSYGDYMLRFESNDPMFFPQSHPTEGVSEPNERTSHAPRDLWADSIGKHKAWMGNSRQLRYLRRTLRRLKRLVDARVNE
jgi:hypothetical protein